MYKILQKQLNVYLSENFVTLASQITKLNQTEYYQKISQKSSNQSTSPKRYWIYWKFC